MWDIIKAVITDANFIGAIISSLAFIFLGYLLRSKNIISADGKKAISVVVLKIALPAMAISCFMVDLDYEVLKENIIVFIISLLLYILLISLGNAIFRNYDKQKRAVLGILITVGQLTFFTIPMLKAIYADNVSSVLLPANMMTLAFRLVLYIYCYLSIANLSFNKENLASSAKKVVLNPIMIAMFVGIFIWLTQDIMPQVEINEIEYSIFRIDKTLPSLFMFISAADKLTTPLAMVIIGCILGESNIKEAMTDKLAWIASILRTIIVPLIVLDILLILQWSNLINFNEYSLVVLVLGFAAPLSAVVSTYTSTYNNNEALASKTCLISTLLCIITYPILYVLIKLVLELPIF